MVDFPAVLELSSLDGSNGFQITGEAANDYASYSVTGAGDINGDGIADFLIGAATRDSGGLGNAGTAYVVFGRAGGGFPAELSLAALDGTNGFRIDGAAQGDYVGSSLSSGDFNGDGISDVLVGAFRTDANGFNSGAAYVVYGRNTATDGAFAANVNVGVLTATTGFRMSGVAASDEAGIDVANAGDINGDGIDDILVGARFADASGSDSGAVYVVFGRNTADDGPFATDVALSSLDGTNGFRLTPPPSANQNVGRYISGAGDINGDGIADLVIGNPYATANGESNAGSAYVLFGKLGAFDANVDLAGLNGANGFRLDGFGFGMQAGSAVAAAGDVNGDGFADLIVTSKYQDGAAFVLFGRNTGFAATLNLNALDGSNGFRVSGSGGEALGWSAAGVGDVNSDGIDDFVLGAIMGSPGGRSGAGNSYVVFGRSGAGAFAANLAVSTLNGTNGFRIAGEAAGSRNGFSVGAAGDVNGDGVSDIIVSSRAGTTPGVNGQGASYIVFGLAPPAPPVVQTAGPAGDTLTGDTGNDILTGNIGKDKLYGLDGDDTLDGGDNNDLIYGGAGADVVRGGEGGDTLYGGDGVDDLDGGTGADKLYGDGGDDIIVGALGNDYMYGGADNDSLSGAGGNDMLDGGVGADAMAGGVGNDVYIVDDIGDTISEAPDEGLDIVRSFITWTLGDNLEALQLQGGGDIDGTGNALGNNMQGNAGANRLWGLAGVDTINGNDGDDVIVGGLNNDLLRGGLGADTFVVLQESVNTAVLETDTVYDFSTAEGDRLDLSAIDANTLIGGDQGFVLVSSFSNAGGEMTMTFSGGQTTIRLDVDGDKAADYQIRINGDVTGDSAGWLL